MYNNHVISKIPLEEKKNYHLQYFHVIHLVKFLVSGPEVSSAP